MRQGVEGADEDSHWRKFVDMTGNGKCDEQKRVLQPIPPLPQIAEFTDEIKECEQREEGDRDEERRAINLTTEVASQSQQRPSLQQHPLTIISSSLHQRGIA